MTVTQMSKQAGKSVSPDSDRLADQIYRHFFLSLCVNSVPHLFHNGCEDEGFLKALTHCRA